tara:strand:+ start:347 stop:562 length:216 start_codon:yes stop_codon:yes gene_type:complete
MDKLKEEKKLLEEEKHNLSKQLQYVNEKILNIEFKIIDLCGKTTGHDFVTEREIGPYGERFTWCRLCNYGN